MRLEDAYSYCKEITTRHYENFPVASVLLPRALRKHIYPIYAFARHADDLADEHNDRPGLLEWREQLHRSIAGDAEDPIFLALADTMEKFDLPGKLFDDLISAFLQDLEKSRYQDLDDLDNYCERSANPVGRLILLLHGYRDEQLFAYSDHICTALQLTNFWQDVTVDLKKNRIYVPGNYLEQFHVMEAEFYEATASPNFVSLMTALVAETRQRFRAGLPLLRHLHRRLRWELTFTVAGGMAILSKIEQNGFNVLQSRPTLSKTDWLKISFRLFTSQPGYA